MLLLVLLCVAAGDMYYEAEVFNDIYDITPVQSTGLD